MTIIHLGSDWTLGATIGRGGMGEVREAKSTKHPRAVAKLIPKAPGSDREVLFADLPEHPNVVPVIDHGETDQHLVLVMPRADHSLRDYINRSGGVVAIEEAISILSDIAAALEALDGHVVHRDIKPENVLLLNGRWCLADFGISRYAEASTAPDTQKYKLTPEYASPEQWRGERATPAADIYALGIVAYELVAHNRPFLGPDFRHQHLHEEPAAIAGIPVALSSLIDECLYKAPQTRPPAANFRAKIARVQHTPPLSGLAQLQQANAEQVSRIGEAARAASAAQSEEERRREVASSARRSITRYSDTLRDAVVSVASAASLQPKRGGMGGWTISLNRAELSYTAPREVDVAPWGPVGPNFDVVCYAEISVTAIPGQQGYRGRSHSLYFCDAEREGAYQWYELAFMDTPIISRSRRSIEPFSLPPNSESGGALGPGMNMIQVGWPMTELTMDTLDDFVNRWSSHLAAASSGPLNYPMMMPEKAVERIWRVR